MRAIFRLTDPKELEATMEITMTLKDWEEVRDQLASKWPSSQLSKAVGNVLHHATSLFYSDGTEVL